MFLLRDLVSARTWLAMTQHLAGLFIGFVAIFIVTFGLGFGVGGLFFALVGLPLLGVTLRLADWFVSDAVEKGAAKLRPILKRAKPDLIYLPHELEWHPDHKAALPMVRAALKDSGTVKLTVRAYEVWTPLPSHDHVEDISAVMPRKLRALRAHKSQLQEFDYVRAVSGLNQFRGALAARRPFAEVFQSVDLLPVR